MRRICLPFLLLLTTTVWSQPPAEFINQNEAERIIAILASDSLKGRGNFTREIEKAALFIAGEFRNIGLKEYENDIGYLQPFVFVENDEPLEQVVLNGKALKPTEYYLASPYRFPPHLKSGDFTEKTFDQHVKTGCIMDSLRAWATVNQPMLICLPPGRSELLRALHRYADTLGFPANVRLVVCEMGLIKNITIYFKPALRKRMLFNVVGVLPGKTKPDEWILVTAHYDHVGVSKKRRDSIFNGANDNASGTAAMMMLANYFAAHGNNERSLVFIAFAGEEIGLLGSRYFAQNTKGSVIKAVVNLEMLGKPHLGRYRECMVTGGGDLPSYFRMNASEAGIKIAYDEWPEQRLFRRSDNYPFFLKGVPAHTFMNWIDNDPDYHQASDELRTLDLQNMCELLKGLIPGLQGLASGEFTPHVTGE